MLVNNGGGLPGATTDNPELIAQPRERTPAVVCEGLEGRTRAGTGFNADCRWTWSAQKFRYGSDP